MEKLVLCGKFRSESPVGEDSCNSQSALDFITCSNNRAENDNESGVRLPPKNKSNLNRMCKNSSLSTKNGCQSSNHYVDLDVRSNQDQNKGHERGKPTPSTIPSTPKPVKFPTTEKSKSKQDEARCFAGFFDDDDDDDDDDGFNNDNDKENAYQQLASDVNHQDHKVTSCVNKKKRKDETDHQPCRRDLGNEVQIPAGEACDSEERICYVSNLTERFSIVRKIGSGTFGSVFLAVRLRDQRKVALKKLPKDRTKIEDFCLEFRYGRQFSGHPCVLETSPVAYITRSWYVLVQEYAPMSDLLRSVPPRVGLPEVAVKSVVRQVTGAVEFIHSRQVVHRDLKLENILVFQDQGDRMLTRVKLGDFGVARKVGTMVCKVCDGTTYTPPEICSLVRHAYYRVERSADVWSLGVVIFCLMTGSFPWQLADINTDPLFQSFARWQSRRTPVVPEHWSRFTPTLRSLFQRYLEIRSIKRADVSILPEFLDAPWSFTGPPLKQSGSTNASGVISTCNASGSASTLTCASSNQHLHPSNFSSSAGSSSVICQHHHHHIHNHRNEGVQQGSTPSSLHRHLPSRRDGGNDKTSCDSGSLGRAVHNSTNQRTSATMLDDLYKDNPFKTSGALYSPLLEDEVCEQADVVCNEQNNPGQESQRPVQRCHHNIHHHHLHGSEDKNEKKCPCTQSRKANPPNPLVKESCESRLGQGNNANEVDPETRFRLERVNRWIMNQMT